MCMKSQPKEKFAHVFCKTVDLVNYIKISCKRKSESVSIDWVTKYGWKEFTSYKNFKLILQTF